jgi:hypothetical protein
LDQLSTHWELLDEPGLFLVRYAPAICKYFRALVKNEHDAEELSQEFMLRAVKLGFPHAHPDQGRFRVYLKTAVRNAAFTYLRRNKVFPLEDPALPSDSVAEVEDYHSGADGEWIAAWQRCVLERAWRALEGHQQHHAGNLAHTILRLATENPDESSQALADRAAALCGRLVSAEAYRKQLSRARHLFAELVAAQVWQTLDEPTPAKLEEELIEIGLLESLRDFLPADWRTRAWGSTSNVRSKIRVTDAGAGSIG